jgi:hypothetical protein
MELLMDKGNKYELTYTGHEHPQASFLLTTIVIIIQKSY